MYVETLNSLMPWVIALDHHHYSRNLPIHIHDTTALRERHPDVYQ